MFALVLAMLMCVALGAGVVGYVMLEARREGRGEFWTPEGEELLAGARRTGQKVVTRSEQLAGSASQRTQALRSRVGEREVRTARQGPARGSSDGSDREDDDRLRPAS
ncbi:hypothetical protein [uncultured Ornithinimicrobium sp.]|uniref:hypothetical protein n=1 Tax=uncultured Ornithinimicrobium sp. TaxID=259307 RepID=UPI0025952E65|nr:hypothetical protein [uncultured Ornithinimicrobium sp.]